VSHGWVRRFPETNHDPFGVAMSQVEITGWRKGCDTISAIKELREKAQLPLNDAHALVNRVLANERVVVSIANPVTATQLADSLGRFGLAAVRFEVESVETAAGR
jgi:hypothetical protein